MKTPGLSLAGYWTPVLSKAVLSSDYNGNLANTFHGLVRIGQEGGYGLAVTGWGYSGWPPSLTIAAPVSIALLVPDGLGGVKLATSDFIRDPLTNGGASVIVADFNGDGRDDILFPAHNESPFVAMASTAYLSTNQGGFTKAVLGDQVMAHDAQLAYIGGKPVVITSTFSHDAADGSLIPGAMLNPVLSYDQGFVISTQKNISTLGGMDAAIVQGVPGSGMVMAFGDVYLRSVDGPPRSNIEIYPFDGTDVTSTQPLQSIIPYLSTLPQYSDYRGWGGDTPGLTHTYRLWSLDLNKDGRGDLLAGESMWTASRQDWPSALQVLLCQPDGRFRDATASLNPDMSLQTNEMDYTPQFIDIDHSGIETLLFSGSTSYGSMARQSDYVLLNDGTGRLHIGLHDQFFELAKTVFRFLNVGYDDTSTPPRFIGLPQSDGSINFVAEYKTVFPNSDVTLNAANLAGYTYVNVPLAYNPTFDFTEDVKILDRNGSALMRTWAGNDEFHDTGSGPNAQIDGGLGINMSVYSGLRSQYQITRLLDGSTRVSTSAGAQVPVINDTLKNVQILKFTDQQIDLLAGGSGPDTIIGTLGPDTIEGGNGVSYLRGAEGNDSLVGGTDHDDINGNMGNDTAHGYDGDDWVVGGKDNDLLFGDAGWDIVYGNMGNDTVLGGDGNDWLRGGQGDDSLMGGDGDDWIWGDRGNDTLSGGPGADMFHSFAGAGLDWVVDFNPTEGDRIILDGSPTHGVSQVGADTVIDLGHGDQVILVGVTFADLGTGWLTLA